MITSAAIGATVHDKATVTGSGPAPTGTVDFTWYNNATCSTAAAAGIAAGTVTLVAGVAHPSSDEVLTATGGSFKAHYNGDSVYNASDGPCEPLTGQKLDSTTTTDVHAGPGANDTAAAPSITQAAIGSTVHDKATVTGVRPDADRQRQLPLVHQYDVRGRRHRRRDGRALRGRCPSQR